MITDTKRLFQKIQNEIARLLPELGRLKQERTLKEDNSFVTKADLLMQEVIHGLVLASDSSARLVSEEDQASQFPVELSDSVYVLDPIDGTENFTSGMPEWGISLSHYHNCRHVASMLGCPELGVWMQTGDPLTRFQSRIRGLSSSLTKEQILAATTGYEYRILGCCVYNMINVIRGSFCSFENPKGANSWDILGGLNLALEHNLAVTVEGNIYAGEYLKPDRKYRFKVENQ